jgi:Skp family chaperone for outer membrane proteins
MRSVPIAALALVLSAAPAFSQAPARPAQQPAAPAQPPPTQAPPAQAAPAPQPPAPFPQGAKMGLVNLQEIAQSSAEGKVSTSKVQALIQKKQNEGTQKAKTLQDNQTKLAQSGALMNEQARTQLEKEIEKQTVEGQRFQQDAQAEVTELQTELQNEFQKKLFPILQQLAQEKGLHILMSAQDAGAIWWEPGIDLTVEAIKRMDASAAPAAPKPAAAPKQ